MARLVSAKGSDVLAWRAAGDFAVTYRQLILNRMEFCLSEEAGSMLDGTVHALEVLAEANDAFCGSCERMIAEAAACHDPARLKELTADFYVGLYGRISLYRSAPAFYQFSTLFLHAVSAAVCRNSAAALGLSSQPSVEPGIIALGPAGRQEFSPFCPLQFMLVHELDAGPETVSRFADLLHEGFRACGLRVDDTVTPRNPVWRGTAAEWEMRLETVLGRGRPGEVIEILRLADQIHLSGSPEIGNRFRQYSLTALSASHAAMGSLVSRVVGLSNGIGMMGGLRFEKNGPHRGLFALLEHALQPLSASVSLLGLLKVLETTATPRRVRELLWRRDLNVDLAERLLQAWHMLHELRLTRESVVQPDWSNATPLYLDIDELDAAEQDSLRESLEAIGTIQRHIGLNFSGIGE